MDKAQRRILQGPLAFEIARFGVPLALGMFLQNLFNLIDAYLIAQLPHEEVGASIGALGICDQIAAIGTILSYGVTTATSALLSNQKGSGNVEATQRTAWQSMLIVVFLGVLFGILGLFFSGAIVRDVVGAKGAVAEQATRYLRVVVGGSITIFLLLQLTTIQRALGSAKTPVALLVAGNALNVVLAILLIFGDGPAPRGLGWMTGVASVLHIPRMGLMGAAWATILARSIVLVPNAIILAKRFQILRPPRGERGPDPRLIGRIASLAWPTSAQFVVRIAGMLMVQSLVARFYTTPEEQTATTAMGVVFRLDTIALFVAMGWGSAAQTFVGQNLGAGNDARARASGWVTGAYDVVTNLGILALLMVSGESILRVFAPEAGPVAIALHYLQVVAPTYVGLGFGVVLGNAMAGAGATRTTLWVDVVIIVAFQLPLSILVVSVWDAPIGALFQCVAAANVASAVAYSAVYARGGWQRAVRRIAV